MPLFRKKPITVEAHQFYADDTGDWPSGVYASADSPTGYYIDTLEGRMEVTDGDFIVTGVQQEKYPVKPSIFVATYDPLPQISADPDFEAPVLPPVAATIIDDITT